MQQMPQERTQQEIVEVHNAYTLYELGQNGEVVKRPMLAFCTRPQDWGNPRWHYTYVKIEVGNYINHCHLWQEIERTPTEACKVIGSALFMVPQPSMDKELCGKTHLDEGDFWCDEWGEMPPVYIKNEDEDYWGGYFDGD